MYDVENLQRLGLITVLPVRPAILHAGTGGPWVDLKQEAVDLSTSCFKLQQCFI